MYIKTIKLEKAALKDYRNDPLTDDELDDLDEEEQSYFSNLWGSWSSKKVGDDEANFEGGSRRGDIEMTGIKGKRKKNQPEEQGIFKRILVSMSGTRNNSSYHNG
jgi:hypothetical protein